MNMYGSNKYKRAGIAMQPVIAAKIKKLFEARGYDVDVIQSTLHQDMKQKFDYTIIFKDGTKKLRDGEGNVHESITCDVKWAKSFTLYDNNGKNTLENSTSTFIVFNLPQNPSELIFINTAKFRECLNVHKPTTRLSEEANNKSRYFFIENYLVENKKYLENCVKRYTV